MSTVPIHPNAPTWFRRALAVPFTDCEIVVGGAAIHFVAWGEPGRRGLVFVHGGGAQAHWWTHIAAPFARDFRVLAIDLSGHGDSAHRELYELSQWTDEVVAVAEAGAIEGRPVVIGHSMGGFVTIATAALHPGRLDGVIICDSPVTTPDAEVRSFHSKDAFGHPRTYATIDEALARFRPVPDQADNLDYVMDHVARRSVCESRAGGSGSSTVPSSSRSRAACVASRSPTSRECAAASRSCVRSGGSSHATSAPRCTKPWDGSLP